jgi:hypothetical protein
MQQTQVEAFFVVYPRNNATAKDLFNKAHLLRGDVLSSIFYIIAKSKHAGMTLR